MRRATRLAFPLALCLLLGGACAPAPAPPTPPAPPPAPTGETRARPAEGSFTVIIMPDNSFEPTTAFVKVGTTVTWRNEDDAPHQPRANPHPTHGSNPAFGPNAPRNSGETYSYTFEKEERLLYHDHLNPSFGGAIDVLP